MKHNDRTIWSIVSTLHTFDSSHSPKWTVNNSLIIHRKLNIMLEQLLQNEEIVQIPINNFRLWVQRELVLSLWSVVCKTKFPSSCFLIDIFLICRRRNRNSHASVIINPVVDKIIVEKTEKEREREKRTNSTHTHAQSEREWISYFALVKTKLTDNKVFPYFCF